jgi:predicted PP-loop superfamily ATPase
MLTSDQIAELKVKINGRRVVASISGGKDSAATSWGSSTTACSWTPDGNMT